MDLRECYEKGFIRKISPNNAVVASLIEIAEIKHEEVLLQKLTGRNISAYFTMYYDAIRELLEAYCLRAGFKVLNHVCLGEQMKKLRSEFDFQLFDRVRYIRNGISYYGKRVSFVQGSLLLQKMHGLYDWLRDQLD